MIKRVQELKKQIKRATKDADEIVTLNGTNYCLHDGNGNSEIIDNFVMDLLDELEREVEAIIKRHKDLEDRMSEEKVEIPLKYAKNLLKVLENYENMSLEFVSQEIKDMVPKKVYDKLVEIQMKYHNANCGPFNRYLESKIKEASNCE